jgi:membrane-associated phospholipid phosphatase
MAFRGRIGARRAAARLWWLPLAPLGFLTDRGSRRRWLLMPVVVILTALTSSLGKLAVRRPRPGSGYRVVPWGRLGAAGFPSTHSSCAFAIAGWLRGSRHGRALHIVAVLIGYSRVRCRAHHPADVIAGAMLGYGVSLQVERLGSKVRAIGSRPEVDEVATATVVLLPDAPPGPVLAEVA